MPSPLETRHSLALKPAVVLAACAWMLIGLSVATAGVGDYECSDPSKVYLGNQRLFQRPGSVDCDRIYSHIPEYREILRRGLTDRSPQYHILMKRATRRFTAAVKKMAAEKRHDLVAQVGAVRKVRDKAKDIPDRTQDVIAALD